MLQLPDELVDALGSLETQFLLRGHLAGCLADLHHRRRDLVGRRLLLLRREDRLLEHRGGRAHQLADLACLPRSLLGGEDRRVRLVLDSADDLADRLGRVHRALCQLPYLRGDHCKALAGVACAGGLDCRVQCEQVRLLRDLVDQLEDLADLLRALTQRQRPLGNRLDLLLHVAHRVAGLRRRGRDRAGVVRDRRCGCGQLFDRRGGLRDGCALLRRRGCRLVRGGPQFCGDAAEHAQRRAHVADEVLEVLLAPADPSDEAERKDGERDATQHGKETGDDAHNERLASGRVRRGSSSPALLLQRSPRAPRAVSARPPRAR